MINAGTTYAPSTVRAAGIAQPADALLVVAKRRRVLQRVGHVEEGLGGSGVVPVDEPDDVVTLKDAVLGPEVAMANDLSRRAGPGVARPHTVGGRPVARDGVVVPPQEARPAPSGTTLAQPSGPDSPSIQPLHADSECHFECRLRNGHRLQELCTLQKGRVDQGGQASIGELQP